MHLYGKYNTHVREVEYPWNILPVRVTRDESAVCGGICGSEGIPGRFRGVLGCAPEELGEHVRLLLVLLQEAREVLRGRKDMIEAGKIWKWPVRYQSNVARWLLAAPPQRPLSWAQKGIDRKGVKE